MHAKEHQSVIPNIKSLRKMSDVRDNFTNCLNNLLSSAKDLNALENCLTSAMNTAIKQAIPNIQAKKETNSWIDTYIYHF